MKKIKNSLWIAGCLLLVGVNIACFLLFPRLVSGVAIVLSNIITVILSFLAFKPINDWLQADLLERQQELIAKLEKDRELERKVEALEQENRTLTDKLDTRVQTGALPVHIDYTFKVEQMEYAKQGYVVKEEEVDALDREKFDIPDRKFFETLLEDSMLKDASIRRVLYIHKFYYKVSLGIDFSKMMYTVDDGRILFYGVRFEKLHDISSEMLPESGDIDRCEILKITGDKTEIRSDKDYDGFKAQYREAQAAEVKAGMEEEVGALCSQYTAALQESIRGRFGDRVDFVDSIEEYRDMNWYSLKASKDETVHEIAANMLMLTTIMNKTQAIGEESFAGRLNAPQNN
jgi:hypothetical protein